MLNNTSVFFGGDTNNHHTDIKVNAVSGGIVKNHSRSYFHRLSLNSDYAQRILGPEPKRRIDLIPTHENHYSRHKDIPVEVLQLVLVGDMEVVAEMIDLEIETKEEEDKTIGQHGYTR